MKKLLTVVLTLAVLFSAFGYVATPQPAEAQIGPMESCEMRRSISIDDESWGAGDEVTIGEYDGEGAIACTINIAYTVTEVLLWLMIALVVLFIVLGGFFILTAGGNTDKVEKGKKFITYSVIGVIIGVLAYVVPWIINFVI